MRHLIYALSGSGNYVEAERSLDAYLTIIETDKKTLERVHAAESARDVIPALDSDETILQTMADGVHLLVKYQNNGKKAMEIAGKLEQDSENWSVENSDVLGSVWYAIGIANSLWSIQSTLLSCIQLM